MKRKTLTLREYITQMGVDEFARRYGVSPRSARAYWQRERRPRPDSDLTMQLLRDGLTIEGIYDRRAS